MIAAGITSDSFLSIAENFKNYDSAMEKYLSVSSKTLVKAQNHNAGEANMYCAKKPTQGGVKRAKHTSDKFLGTRRDPTKWTKASILKSGKKGVNPKANKARRFFFKLASKQGARKNKKTTHIYVTPSDRKKRKVSATVKGVSDDKRYLTKAAATIRNKRIMRAGAMAAGFLQSAKRTGKKIKGARDIQPIKGGSASKSLFHPATEGNLKAYSVNKVAGSGSMVGRKAMVRAVINRIEEMEDHAYKEMRKNRDDLIDQMNPKRR